MNSAANLRPDFRRVHFLLLQMAMVLFANALIFFAPVPWSTAFLFGGYALLAWMEARGGICNPSSIAMCLASAAATVAGVMNLIPLDLPLLLLLLNGALLCASLWQLAAGSRSNLTGSRGSQVLLRRTTQLWLFIHTLGMSIVAALLAGRLEWMLNWIYLLPALPLLGTGLTLWMHFVQQGNFQSDKNFEMGNYRFEEIRPGEENLIPFYRQFVREALPAIIQGVGPDFENMDACVAFKMSLDRDSWPHTHFFVAHYDNEIVGTISCMLKSDRNWLGFEAGHSRPLSVAALCRYGKVCEIGRLSVSKEHRYGRDVLQGLFACVIERAFRFEAAFLVTQSFPAAQSVYRKIGFFAVDERTSHQLGLGAAIVPMAFNLAARVVCGSARSDPADAISSSLTPFCAERYFKRQALRSLFSRKCAWQLAPEEVIALLRPTQPAHAAVGAQAHAG